MPVCQEGACHIAKRWCCAVLGSGETPVTAAPSAIKSIRQQQSKSSSRVAFQAVVALICRRSETRLCCLLSFPVVDSGDRWRAGSALP